jgi:hypothetical protein
MDNTLRLVDSNGCIVGTIDDGDRIVRKSSVEFLCDTVAWGVGRPFIKVFIDYFPKVAEELSGGAVGLMSVIATYIAYRSNLLCNRSSNNPLSNKDIEDITGISKASVARYMDELVDAKVLFRGKTGKSYQYYANPYIYCRGSKINKTLEAMFANYPDKFK